MPNTPRMSWPYPSENQDPWWEPFVSMLEQMDASSFAAREDRSVVLMGGGTMTWNVSGDDGTLTWAEPIMFLSPIAGFLLPLPIAQSPKVLTSGQVLYVDLVRKPTDAQNVTVLVANQVPNTDDALLLAVRYGDALYWRNGLILMDGDSKVLFDAAPGSEDLAQTLSYGNETGGSDLVISAGDRLRVVPSAAGAGVSGSGEFFVSDGSSYEVGRPYYRFETGQVQRIDLPPRLPIPLGFNTILTGDLASVPLSLGEVSFDPSTYGEGVSFRFEVVMRVNDAARTLEAYLYCVDALGGYEVTGTRLTVAGLLSPTKRTSAELVVGTSSGNLFDDERTYQVMLELDGTVVTEIGVLGSAFLVVSAQ